MLAIDEADLHETVARRLAHRGRPKVFNDRQDINAGRGRRRRLFGRFDKQHRNCRLPLSCASRDRKPTCFVRAMLPHVYPRIKQWRRKPTVERRAAFARHVGVSEGDHRRGVGACIDRPASGRRQHRHDPRLLHAPRFSARRRSRGALARAARARPGGRACALVVALAVFRRWRPFDAEALAASDLGQAARGLLAALPLLFVPAGVGVVQYLGLLRDQGLALMAALVVSTVATLIATVGVFLLVKRLVGAKGEA